MGSSVQDFVGIDKITRLTSSSVHAFSSVSDAMAGRRGAGGGGGQFSVSLRIVSTLWLKNWINWSALCVGDAEELPSSLSFRSILDNDCQSFAGVPLSAEIRSVQYLFFFTYLLLPTLLQSLFCALCIAVSWAAGIIWYQYVKRLRW